MKKKNQKKINYLKTKTYTYIKNCPNLRRGANPGLMSFRMRSHVHNTRVIIHV